MSATKHRRETYRQRDITRALADATVAVHDHDLQKAILNTTVALVMITSLASDKTLDDLLQQIKNRGKA